MQITLVADVGIMLMPRFGLVAGLLCGLGGSVTAQEYTLDLRPPALALPSVQAVMDAAAVQAATQPNPFHYDCVAFLQIQNGTGQLVTLQRVGRAWTRSAIWIYPEGRPTLRRHPRVADVVGSDNETLVVTLDPENSELRYVVHLDTAVIRDPALGQDVELRDLVSEPFSVPDEALERCGRVPGMDVEVLAPSENQSGLNVQWELLRRGALGTRGMWEAFGNGSMNTADGGVLLNSTIVGGKLEWRLTDGWRDWLSLGLTTRLEATESFGVIDHALGVTLRWRFRYGLDALRTLLGEFTPYPVLSLELSEIAHVEGKDLPQIATRGNPEIRTRAGIDWTVPLILDATARVKLSADIFFDPPDGVEWFNHVRDITVEYPVTGAGDWAAVLSFLGGRAPPLFEDAAEVLIGLGLRR